MKKLESNLKNMTITSSVKTGAIATIATVMLLLSAGTAQAAGPAPVDLLSAGEFVILSESGVTNVPTSVITGNVGTSPISGSAIGLTCAEVTGTIYSVNAAGPLPCRVTNAPFLTTAVNDMMTAYLDAAGRPGPDGFNLYGGIIGGQTFAPGLYKWTTGVSMAADVTLSGGPNDVWIFQIEGDLNVASGGDVPSGIKVILTGGAQAANVFWQVGGGSGATLGTYSTFNGNILSATQVVLQTGAILNGRALAQTLVTLDQNTVSGPATAGSCDATTQTIVSDTNDMVGSSNAIAIVPHPAWTASIPGSTTWIWQASPTEPDSTVAFEKTFTVTGTTLFAQLDIASDNSYKVFIDGVEVATDPSENNFQLATQDTYNLTADVTPGTHTLRIEVTNIGIYDSSNPAGLLYKLEIVTCDTLPPLPPRPTPSACDSVAVSGGIVIVTCNRGSITNSTTAESSTGSNKASGSVGGRGGRGGSILSNGIFNNGGATSGNGGFGGNGGAGGLVQTGNASSNASTTNKLNGTDVDVEVPVNTNSSLLAVIIDNLDGGRDLPNVIGNSTRARAKSGNNEAQGSAGGSGDDAGSILGGTGDNNNGGATSGNGGPGGNGGTGGTVVTGRATSVSETHNNLNLSRIRVVN